ncbi:hypothetical protein D3C80_1831180 [compost metagenome]
MAGLFAEIENVRGAVGIPQAGETGTALRKGLQAAVEQLVIKMNGGAQVEIFVARLNKHFMQFERRKHE